MRSRLDLHAILLSISGPNATHFQPPNGFQMTYPCIVYALNDVETAYADDRPYTLEKEYLVTIIDKNPDTPLLEKVLALPKCTFDRYLVTDNLNHYLCRLYF